MNEMGHAQCQKCESRLSNIFCDLKEPLISTLNSGKSTRSYAKKQVLFYEGAPPLGIYCVKSGQVKTYKTGLEGKQHILSIVRSKDVLGLESLFAGEGYLYTAEILESGDVCFINRQIVLDTIRQDAATALKIMEFLSQELRASEEERVDLAQSSVRERMARLLTILAQSHGSADKGGIKINLPLSREEMAEMIGTAAETAMRLLKELREEKIVEIHGKEIIVLNKQRLVQSAKIT